MGKLLMACYQFLFLALSGAKIICISAVGVFAFRKSLVLETPDPIIEVHITSADNIITLKNHSQLEIMLIWHIATEYCALSEEQRNGITRGVALNLSRYNIYLMASVPDLLPYHEVDIKESFRQLEDKIDKDPWSYEKLKDEDGTNQEVNPMTVFKKGVKLGKQLESMPDGDR
jgi:hypothetical protein